ncbi:MAG: tetratricopeptide (TPR) repeat protein [Phenylobacterium sp.]|jgi:tetratricopeptide (TPR) repeat protein
MQHSQTAAQPTSIEQARAMAIAAMQQQQPPALETLQQILSAWPHDGPLCFLYASELAAQQHYDQALAAFTDAVTFAPELHIARLQLCLLAASNEALELMQQHLPVLVALGEQDPIGCFAGALTAIFADDQPEGNVNASRLLQQGIKLNQQNPALNQDMEQLLSRINQAPAESESETNTSNTLDRSVLLDIYHNRH